MVVQPERLGERIRTLRYRRGLTQAQLAYKAGVGEKTLKRVEAGQTDMPRPETLAALAGALGVTPEALFEPAEGSEPAAGRPAIHQLPRPPHNFVGRGSELAAVEAKLADSQELIGVHGMGGVGKTAFALVLAERVSARCPDGQLYFDLRGSADERAVVEAMQHVIRSLEPARPTPKSVGETAAVYRTVLRDKRLLLLLENVANAEQVEQLRPPLGSLAIVTSRPRLALPGHFALTLGPLEPADACALIDTLAPHASAVQDTLAGLCGGLPLALSLAGRALAERPDLDPHEYTARLADDSGRLAQLDASGSGGSAGGGGVEASFELSYEMLEPSLRAELYTLSVFPQDFDRAAVAAVWQLDPAATDARIGQLVRFNLLEWDGAGKVARYRLHDLVRLFLDARLPREQRLAAGLRHARHFADRLFAASSDLEGGHQPTLALLSIDQDWPHVRAAFAFCRAHTGDVEGAAELCSRIPDASTVLRLRLHPRERIEWLEAAIEQARARGDSQLSGRLLAHLGRAHQELGDPRRARELCSAAQAIAEACGDKHTQAHALVALGDAHHALGEARLAIEASERGLALARELGADADVASAQVVLGWGYQVLGDSVRAAEYAALGVPVARRIGDRSLESTALLAIAFAKQTLGDMEGARVHGEQVLTIARELGDRRMEGYALLSLSQPMAPAAPSGLRHREALQIALETGDRRMEGYATIMEGVSSGAGNDLRAALRHLERALAIADETGDKAMLGTTANALGLAYSASRQTGRAIECLTRAERTLAETGNRRAESTSAWLLGSALELVGDLEGAVAAMERAARYQAETKQPVLAQTRARIAALRARIDGRSAS